MIGLTWLPLAQVKRRARGEQKKTVELRWLGLVQLRLAHEPPVQKIEGGDRYHVTSLCFSRTGDGQHHGSASTKTMVPSIVNATKGMRHRQKGKRKPKRPESRKAAPPKGRKKAAHKEEEGKSPPPKGAREIGTFKKERGKETLTKG